MNTKVIYSLALAILLIALASAASIPTRNQHEIQSANRIVPGAINGGFHGHGVQRHGYLVHAAHKNPHHGSNKGHGTIKSPHFSTTEATTTGSYSEISSTAAVTSNVTDSVSQSVSTTVSTNVGSTVSSTVASTSEATTVQSTTKSNNSAESTTTAAVTSSTSYDASPVTTILG